MADYLPIVLLLGIATAFVFGSFVASAVLGPTRQEFSAKTGPYECGIVPEREPAERFPVKFYLVAMIFIIFDIEIIFLYPWAVIFNQLGTFGLVEMVLFSVAVIVAFVYLISNGALDWGPAARINELEDRVATARTSSSTIRRVPATTSAAAAASTGEAA